MKTPTPMQLPRTLLGALAFALSTAGCGAGTPPAESPESDDSDASSHSSALETEGRSHSTHADPTVGVTVKDETKKEATACAGEDFPDLIAVLSQASCEVPADKAAATPQDLTNLLEVKIATDAPKVAPGGTSKVSVVLKNKGKLPLSLDFAVDPEPRFEFEVYTVKGSRVDKPAGDEPSLPPEVQSAPQPDKGIARVTLDPGGKAKLAVTWTAVKYKWVSKDKAKGALPGHGYPREPGNPLPKGKYVLRLLMPLVNINEGVDHEMSQPRVPVEVGAL